MRPSLHQASPAELRARIEAERAGTSFLIVRDEAGDQRILALEPVRAPLSVGRDPAADVRLVWDREVSRLHAELQWMSGHWTLSDHGLSRNGSYVNGERIAGTCRLQDGDHLSFGATKLIFRSPSAPGETPATRTSIPDSHVAPPVSDAQRRVAVALCRPFGGGGAFAAPATNQEIADDLHLSVPAVKTHLRALFAAFGVEELPRNEKRLRLVELLLRTGVVGEHELRAP